MKRITLVFLLFFSVSIVAQQGINYKAVIKDGSGAIIVSTGISLQFIILDGAVPVYQESYSATTDANGIVILNIGEGTPVTGTFSAIDWSSNNHFLNVQIDTGGGLQDMGTTAFKTVPYALHAKTAEYSFGPDSVVEDTGGTSKICSGSTVPGVGWLIQNSNTIRLNVVTTGCNFSSTPRYLTSISGLGGHFELVGFSAIYSATPTGFTIYVQKNNGTALSSTDAVSAGWFINWTAIGN